MIQNSGKKYSNGRLIIFIILFYSYDKIRIVNQSLRRFVMEVIVMYSIGLIVISFIIAVTKSKLKGKAGEVTINHFF